MYKIFICFNFCALPCRSIPSSAIAVTNKEVMSVLAAPKSRKRWPCHRYTSEQRASIGRYAVVHGVLATARKYS